MKALLNGICPYFTMFPLRFPLGVLQGHARPGQAVLDPFAGRGTTLYAARLLGLPAYGIDSNPVAAAVSEAKLANTSPEAIIAAAQDILRVVPDAGPLPQGEFWNLAFAPTVLEVLCRLRRGLLQDCLSPERKALRALLLGVLHGPRTKGAASYLSNQCTRTYAPKPGYAVNFWRERGLQPPHVDVLELIRRKAARFYGDEPPAPAGAVTLGDSMQPESFRAVAHAIDWIITSPPYYGMRTYRADQWLRLWLVGGPPTVDYSNKDQLPHRSQAEFVTGLRQVWQNCALVAKPGSNLVVRFGAINDRPVDPLELLRESLEGTPWRLVSAQGAGTASDGKRQAKQFERIRSAPVAEIDAWAVCGR